MDFQASDKTLSQFASHNYPPFGPPHRQTTAEERHPPKIIITPPVDFQAPGQTLYKSRYAVHPYPLFGPPHHHIAAEGHHSPPNIIMTTSMDFQTPSHTFQQSQSVAHPVPPFSPPHNHITAEGYHHPHNLIITPPIDLQATDQTLHQSTGHQHLPFGLPYHPNVWKGYHSRSVTTTPPIDLQAPDQTLHPIAAHPSLPLGQFPNSLNDQLSFPLGNQLNHDSQLSLLQNEPLPFPLAPENLWAPLETDLRPHADDEEAKKEDAPTELEDVCGSRGISLGFLDGLSSLDDDGQVVKPGSHVTGVVRLLLWPAVRIFLRDKFMEENIKSVETFVEYPYIQESKHGISLYGRGPGSNHTQESSDNASDLSELTGPAHGQISFTKVPAIQIFQGTGERHGGLGPDGQLELDEATVQRLVSSYLEHIHILHPIICPAELRIYTRRFLETAPQNLRLTTKSKAPGAITKGKTPSGGVDEMPVHKRKRPMCALEPKPSFAPKNAPGRLKRSIENALLLLVLALGKICECKEKIPDLIPEHDKKSSSSSRTRTRSHLTQPPALPPKQGPNQSSPRTVKSSRNSDVIPGLAYAALATDMIGNELGENTLHHVRANILAGLYFDQLLRPSYSHRFISNACVSLQIILRPELKRFRKYKPAPNDFSIGKLPVKDNPLIFAFWTCLQLEGEITAELDLPQSGIAALEMHMPLPNQEAAMAAQQLTRVEAGSYEAQIYLLRHLRTVNEKGYGIGTGESLKDDYNLLRVASKQTSFPAVEAMVDSIPDINIFAPFMSCSERDSPTKRILAARVRAKYHDIEVITYRPFLWMVMNRPSRVAQVFAESNSTINIPRAEKISKTVMKYARLCITAMENSTRAFHGRGSGRLIITNIWGTAHIQWGNVLLLLVAYQDPILKPFINRDNLQQLVTNTLEFLSSVADPGSALQTDIRILEFAARKMAFLP